MECTFANPRPPTHLLLFLATIKISPSARFECELHALSSKTLYALGDIVTHLKSFSGGQQELVPSDYSTYTLLGTCAYNKMHLTRLVVNFITKHVSLLYNYCCVPIGEYIDKTLLIGEVA